MSDEFGSKIEESFSLCSISEAQNIVGMFDLQNLLNLLKFCTFGLERTKKSGSFQQLPRYVPSRKSTSSVLYFTTILLGVQFRWTNISLSAIRDHCSRRWLSCAVGCNPQIAGRLSRLIHDALYARKPYASQKSFSRCIPNWQSNIAWRVFFYSVWHKMHIRGKLIVVSDCLKSRSLTFYSKTVPLLQRGQLLKRSKIRFILYTFFGFYRLIWSITILVFYSEQFESFFLPKFF